MYTEHHLHLLSFTWNCHPSAVGLMPCWCLLYECSIFEDFAQTLILLWNCMLASPYRCFSIPATLIFFTSISLSLSHGGYLPVFMLFFHLSPTSSLLNLGYALESSREVLKPPVPEFCPQGTWFHWYWRQWQVLKAPTWLKHVSKSKNCWAGGFGSFELLNGESLGWNWSNLIFC